MSNDETDLRPWYRIHCATLGAIAVVVAWFVFINIPGDRLSVISKRYSHGWPYHYFEREGPDRTFWTFSGPSPQFSAGPLILNALTAFCVAALVALACELWIRRNGRLFRFGLRSVFLLTTAVAVLMGLVVREVHQCQRQNQTLRELAQLGSVTTKRDLRKYDWFRSLFGRDYDGAITRVEVAAPRPTNGPLPDLSSLQQVEFLELDNIALTANDVDQFASLPKLHGMSVSMSAFRSSDAAGLRALTAFPKLFSLHLRGESFTDETLEHFSRDSQIQILHTGSNAMKIRTCYRNMW